MYQLLFSVAAAEGMAYFRSAQVIANQIGKVKIGANILEALFSSPRYATIAAPGEEVYLFFLGRQLVYTFHERKLLNGRLESKQASLISLGALSQQCFLSSGATIIDRVNSFLYSLGQVIQQSYPKFCARFESYLDHSAGEIRYYDPVYDLFYNSTEADFKQFHRTMAALGMKAEDFNYILSKIKSSVGTSKWKETWTSANTKQLTMMRSDSAFGIILRGAQSIQTKNTTYLQMSDGEHGLRLMVPCIPPASTTISTPKLPFFGYVVPQMTSEYAKEYMIYRGYQYDETSKAWTKRPVINIPQDEVSAAGVLTHEAENLLISTILGSTVSNANLGSRVKSATATLDD